MKPAKNLPQMLKDAFPAEALTAAKVVTHQNDDEYKGVAREFGGKSWAEVPRSAVEKNRDRLPFFSPAGFRAHLAGFLLAAYEGNADVAQAAVFALDPPAPKKADLRAHFDERAHMLTAAQRAAVAEFLRWVVADQGDDFPNGEPAAALKYWEKPVVLN